MTTTALDARAREAAPARPATSATEPDEHDERLSDLVLGVLVIPFAGEPRVRHALADLVRARPPVWRAPTAVAALVAWLGYVLAIVVHLLACLPLLVSVVLAWALVAPLLVGVVVGRAVGRLGRRG